MILPSSTAGTCYTLPQLAYCEAFVAHGGPSPKISFLYRTSSSLWIRLEDLWQQAWGFMMLCRSVSLHLSLQHKCTPCKWHHTWLRNIVCGLLLQICYGVMTAWLTTDRKEREKVHWIPIELALTSGNLYCFYILLTRNLCRCAEQMCKHVALVWRRLWGPSFWGQEPGESEVVCQMPESWSINPWEVPVDKQSTSKFRPRKSCTTKPI